MKKYRRISDAVDRAIKIFNGEKNVENLEKDIDDDVDGSNVDIVGGGFLQEGNKDKKEKKNKKGSKESNKVDEEEIQQALTKLVKIIKEAKKEELRKI
jgi:hypothetical protein